MHRELAIDIGAVSLDRLDTDRELLGNRGIGVPANDEIENLTLPIGEAIELPRGTLSPRSPTGEQR
jgi:hypothetical protein